MSGGMQRCSAAAGSVLRVIGRKGPIIPGSSGLSRRWGSEWSGMRVGLGESMASMTAVAAPRVALQAIAAPCRSFSGVGGGGGGDGVGGGGPAGETEHERKARVLKERLMRGGLHDHTHVHKAKMFTAGEKVLAAKDSVAFPDLVVEPLAPSAEMAAGGTVRLQDTFGGQITLLTLSFKQHGYEQNIKWQEGYMHYWERLSHSDSADWLSKLQTWDIHFSEGMKYMFLKPIIRNGLKRTIDESAHSQTATHFARYAELFCDDAKVHNQLIGYCYLIDGSGLVRWRAHAEPDEVELSAMEAALDTLLEENRRWQ